MNDKPEARKPEPKCSECHYDNDGDCQFTDCTGEICIGKCGWEKKTGEDGMSEQTSECKGCGEKIVWIKVPSGKMIPCDPKIHVVVSVVHGVIQGRVSHFATCPKADSFRKKPVDSKP